MAIDQPPAVDDSAELLARARAGEAEAFRVVARRHEVRLFRQALALCGVEALAEDLVVETMVEAWRSLGRFDGSCRFTTWLYAILLHRHQKAARKAWFRPSSFSSGPEGDHDEGERWLAEAPTDRPGPGEVMVRAEWAGRLLAAIRTLPEIHQEVLLLRFYEDASLGEMACALGLSLGTVKSRLHHALGKLRQVRDVVNLFREAKES